MRFDRALKAGTAATLLSLLGCSNSHLSIKREHDGFFAGVEAIADVRHETDQTDPEKVFMAIRYFPDGFEESPKEENQAIAIAKLKRSDFDRADVRKEFEWSVRAGQYSIIHQSDSEREVPLGRIRYFASEGFTKEILENEYDRKIARGMFSTAETGDYIILSKEDLSAPLSKIYERAIANRE